MSTKTKAPVRLETGYLRTPDDWDGVFIRGDNALHQGMNLSQLMKMLRELSNRDDVELPEDLKNYISFFVNISGLDFLADLLCDSNQNIDKTVQVVDFVKNPSKPDT